MLLTAELPYGEVREARFQLPTVRDSNRSLLQREVARLGTQLNQPDIGQKH